MERGDVVAYAANDMRRRYARKADMRAFDLVQLLCQQLALEIAPAARQGAMLGGAYARLQLWQWEKPQIGGFIWVYQDLPPAAQAFAIAHELGHYVLHRGEGVALHPPCDETQVDERAGASELRTQTHRVEEYTPRARRELEANTFAAELLAPCNAVRALFTSSKRCGVERIGERFGITHTLARQRLIDAVFSPIRPANTSTAELAVDAEPASAAERQMAGATALLTRLDSSQQEAACVAGPALVVAGPGTGKTATLIGRVAHLVVERGAQPERVLALTFSNRAAGEMRERLAQSGLPGERMPVMTIHAFAATLLREYAMRVPHAPAEPPLASDFRILDQADAFLLLEELLAELPLYYYRSLGNPTQHLRTLLDDFSRARDNLLTPADYLMRVEAMPLRDPASEADASSSDNGADDAPPTYTAEQIARARERASAYAVWDRALRQRDLVDFGGLIQRAVELLHADSSALADVRGRYPEVLVDEFQDTNQAAAELLLLVAGEAGQGLWVVGDRNQAIYRWRGASPANLRRLAERYPTLRICTLRRSYRAVPALVQLGSAMAARMAELSSETSDASEEHISANTAAVLHEALQPIALEATRAAEPYPPVLRGEDFATDATEWAGLTLAIQRHHTQGFSYGDQAVLCRKNTQVERISAALAEAGLPVGQSGEFFARPEIKDLLTLAALAAYADARGVLRARPLVCGLGYAPPAHEELACVMRVLISGRQLLPGALTRLDRYPELATISPTTRHALHALGDVAWDLRRCSSISTKLADFLLRPGGYAWRLACQADGLTTTANELAPQIRTAAQAQVALAALGEMLHLALRFDVRWSREPDFRMRLTRAVRRQRGASDHALTLASPILPDSYEPDDAADVADVSAPSVSSASAATSTTPVIRCFLHYLDALRIADIAITLPASAEDAVQVMTIHASKGLEFSAVYLPCLAQGQFPLSKHGSDEACPPGFREEDNPGAREAEERCLFYVGMTRARDVAAFTRAASYGAKGMTAQPSSLFALLDDTEPYQQAEPLLTNDEMTALPGKTAAPEAEGSDEPKANFAQVDKKTYPLHALEQYLICPRQYKYAQVYQLLDPAEDAVYCFHRYLRQGRRTLQQVCATSPGTSWATAELQLREDWAASGPVGHAYEAFYWKHAQSMLQQEWHTLTASAAAAQPSTLLAQHLYAELVACIVEVTADRIISQSSPDENSHSNRATTLVRQHTGRQHASDRNDLALPLYYLAYRQRHPETSVRITLAYVGDALTDAEPATDADAQPQSITIDVTKDARKDAEKYLKPDRRQRSKLDKLDAAALGIESGAFAPKPNEQTCATCAYCYVCPADPESGM